MKIFNRTLEMDPATASRLPALTSGLSRVDVKSLSSGIDDDIGKNLPTSNILTGVVKQYASARLTQLRYILLVLALAGACWLLTALLLKILCGTTTIH